MFKKLKSKVSAALAWVLAFTAASALTAPVDAGAAASIEIGEYVEMGTYYGEPILWRCVDIDENGPLMLSDKLICLKPFDAYSDNTSGSHGRSYNNGYYRKRYGSNYWADSNMRSWLNSNASAGNVTWLCGNPPDNAHVWSGYNDYAGEAGFKTNFTSGELGAVKTVTQDSLLNYNEYSDMSPYGSTYHTYNYNISNVVQNAKTTAYREKVTDDFFLLDVNQINAVYNNRSILGSNYYIGEPTAQAVANSEYTSSSLKSGNKWNFWLRSPRAIRNDGSDVRRVSADGCVRYNSAYGGYGGVRPAFYLNLPSSSFTSGSGTASAPYRVYGTGKSSYNAGVSRAAATMQITVMKNNKDMTDSADDYTACEGAEITVDGKTYKTNKEGAATVPAAGTAAVKYEGYYDESIALGSLANGDKIYLEKAGMNMPVLRAVTVNGADIRRGESTVPGDYSGNITAEIDWNGNTEYETYISNGVSIWQMTDGDTGTIPLGKEFNSSSGISITIKTKNGYSVSKKLHLKVSKTNAAGENISLSFGDGFRNIGSGVIPYFDDMKFDFDIPNFPVELSVDGNKVRGVFGVDVAEWAYENGMFDGEKGEWTTYDDKKKQQAFMTLTELIKNTKSQIEKNKDDEKSVKDQYKELKDKLGKSKITGKGKFGFDADISVTGYVEGTIDQNGIFFSGGGLILSAEAKVGISGSGMLVVVVVPVPYNWEASLKGSIEAQLAIAQRELRSQSLSPSGTIKGSVALKIGAGPGFKKFHANIVGKGSISPAYTFSALQNAFTLDAKFGAYLELVAGRYSKEFKVAEADFRLYPRETKAAKASIASIKRAKLYEPEGYELIGRDYLDGPQEFTANNIPMSVMAAFDAANEESVIKTNVYTMAQPVSAALSDGRELIVWVDDDTEAEAINGTSLMYTIYDGDTYTEPEYVERNGLADYEPQLKTVEGITYLVWEETGRELSAGADINEMESALEIKYAVFNGETFEEITQLTENDYSDSMPQISDVNGEPVITWVGNKGDIMSAENVYSISYAFIGGGAVTAAEDISAVDSHAAAEYNGGIAVIYSADTDGDLQTVSDNELFRAAGGEVLQLTSDELPQTGVSEYFGAVYLNSNGELSVIKDDAITGEGVALADDSYIVLDGGNMVCVTDGIEAEREIYAYIRESGKWGDAVRLTELGANISDISGYITDKGAVRLTFRKRSITGDLGDNIGALFGRADLSSVTIMPSCSVSLDYAYVDKSRLIAGGTAAIKLDVTNKGTRSVNSINVTLLDSDGGELMSRDIETELLPGVTEAVIAEYELPEDFKAFDGVVKITAEDEYDESDNEYELRFDYIDIAVDSASFTATDDGYVISAAVSNNGLRAEDAVINLIKDDEVIASESVSALDALDTCTVTFEGIDPYSDYIVEAEELENEDMIGNNSETVIALREEAKRVTVSAAGGSSVLRSDGTSDRVYSYVMSIPEDVTVTGDNVTVEIGNVTAKKHSSFAKKFEAVTGGDVTFNAAITQIPEGEPLSDIKCVVSVSYVIDGLGTADEYEFELE